MWCDVLVSVDIVFARSIAYRYDTLWRVCIYRMIYIYIYCMCVYVIRLPGVRAFPRSHMNRRRTLQIAELQQQYQKLLQEVRAAGMFGGTCWDQWTNGEKMGKNGGLVDWLDMIRLLQDGIYKRNLRLLHCSCRLLKVNLHNTIAACSTMSSKRRCRARLKMTRLTRWWFQSSSVLALNFNPRLGRHSNLLPVLFLNILETTS